MAIAKTTPKQRKFIEAYHGDCKAAAEQAGLNYDYCRKLITFPHIRKKIQERINTEVAPLIATRGERQLFWSKVMNDSDADIKDRLKAAELLGKSEADFTDTIRNEGNINVTISQDDTNCL